VLGEFGELVRAVDLDDQVTTEETQAGVERPHNLGRQPATPFGLPGHAGQMTGAKASIGSTACPVQAP
jgi:hypothetical protein